MESIDRHRLEAYRRALNPPKKQVTEEQFEQIVYDTVARERTMSREAVVLRARKLYEILSESELKLRQEFVASKEAVHIVQGGVGRARQVFEQNDGEVTKAYYAKLQALGPIGIVGLNLFRAQKRSSRAKDYRRGKFRSSAYDVKQWSLDELCRVLVTHGETLGIRFGWKQDDSVRFGDSASYVIYVDIPHGQCSFHNPARGTGPDYPGCWDGAKGAVEGRVIEFCDSLLTEF